MVGLVNLFTYMNAPGPPRMQRQRQQPTIVHHQHPLDLDPHRNDEPQGAPFRRQNEGFPVQALVLVIVHAFCLKRSAFQAFFLRARTKNSSK